LLFPNRRYADIGSFKSDYFKEIDKAAAAIDSQLLAQAAELLAAVIDGRRWIYVCGNGGSAAISNHLFCDFVKGIQTGTDRRPRVVSLSAQLEIITAIGNDIGYEDIFAYQLRTLAAPGDLLISISSSGDSENIVRAVQWAKDSGMATIALTGFEGGRSAALADVNIHVPANNYGVIEDMHQSLMHILAQFLRQQLMRPDTFGSCKF
jgi:phosphoheptose isomerase